MFWRILFSGKKRVFIVKQFPKYWNIEPRTMVGSFRQSQKSADKQFLGKIL